MKPQELSYYEQLRLVELFDGLNASQLRKLAYLTSKVDFAPNEAIYHAGDVGQGLYIIQSGEIVIEMDIPDYGPITLYTLGQGELFGWSSFIEGRRKKARARAATATTALFLPVAEVKYLFRADHNLESSFMNCIFKVMANRLNFTREQLAHRSTPV